MPILLFMFSIFYSHYAWSYPEFIGYKYSSCLTCHYNGNGNGPLNDYGRALWSAEIAGRLFSGDKSEDQLGESSGFLGSHQLPWWIRPGIKGRELVYRTNPGGSGGQTQNILMQADANVALFFDEDQKKTIVAEFGYVPQPLRLKTQAGSKKVNEWISREHYFRYQAGEPLWFYVGFLDKVYGIRTIDHTAFSRSKTGLAQNDQSHSVIAQYIQPKYEWSGDFFVGNLYQNIDLRQTGFSTMFEYEIVPNMRLGASALASRNRFIENTRAGLHSRTGLGFGSSLMFELGVIRDAVRGGQGKQGYYIFSEAMQRVARGYHLFIEGQAYKDKMEIGHSDVLKGGIGLLMFPLARVEFRLELQNGREYSDAAEVPRDSWTALAQLHVSL